MGNRFHCLSHPLILFIISVFSGPAGYIQYLLYGITSLGFDNPNFKSIVDGIVQSIERAHANVVPGNILYNVGELLEANINRSPTSYMANPQDERDM